MSDLRCNVTLYCTVLYQISCILYPLQQYSVKLEKKYLETVLWDLFYPVIYKYISCVSLAT